MHFLRRLQIGRKMSRILRHHPPPKSIDSSGWIYVHILIENMSKLNPTLEELREVVEKDTKGRFVIDESYDPARIRATQGHTIYLETPIGEEVNSLIKIPEGAVHATTEEAWEEIKNCGYLRRKYRMAIHFATKIGQCRTNREIFLFLDFEAAREAHYVFTLSSNNVLLCEGPLPVEFVNCVKYEDLPAYWKV